ncbi:MAG: helix-turn-helix domain-containing protein, partial [Pseudonocardiaceae bacterium]
MGSERADFAAELARLRADSGLSLADVAGRAHVHRAHVHRLERGERWPSRPIVQALDAALAADEALLARWEAANQAPRVSATSTDERPTELLELAARAETSDVS